MSLDGAWSDDPLAWFNASFERASQSEPFDAARAALATTGPDGAPSVRFVLVRRVDARGFAFFTNLASAKAKHLDAQPHAALAFHWHTLREQVRIEGPVERVSDEEVDAYFATRPRASQLSAWASDQSAPISDRSALELRYDDFERRFEGAASVPRPTHWGGFRVRPVHIEFWIGRDGRLHDRWSFTRERDGYVRQRLQP